MEVTDYVTLDNSPHSQVVFLKCKTGGRGGPCAQCTAEACGSVHLGRLGRHGPAFGCLTLCEAESLPRVVPILLGDSKPLTGLLGVLWLLFGL